MGAVARPMRAPAPCPRPAKRARVRLDVPDEVLVQVLRCVRSASALARLRAVCKRWCRVIDATPAVWRAVSFKRVDLSRGVVSRAGELALGERRGRAAVALAAVAGNEWARFLKSVLFDACVLSAVSAPQPVASLLVAGRRRTVTREFPPCAAATRGGVWVAVHAARASGAATGGIYGADADGSADCTSAALPRGALVGMVHVRDARRTSSTSWMWNFDRAVTLRRPIRCAGSIGLWGLSPFLTEMLVYSMHTQ